MSDEFRKWLGGSACLWLCVFFFFPSAGRAYFENPDDHKKIGEMNGIHFEAYKNFPKEWRLITGRYREDSQEMRFTYANEIAWRAMQSLKPDYPDGSVFGKVGMATEVDPSFPSSKVPSGAKRYQLMVRDKKKYKDSDGWGYALFDGDGFIFNEDPKAKTQSCVACHRIVPERDFVFSRSMSLLPGQLDSRIENSAVAEKILRFEPRDRINLAKAVQAELPSKSGSKVDLLEGELKKHAFSGTLDEIMPVLIDKARKNARPALLLVNEKNFSLAAPRLEGKCPNKEIPFRLVIFFNGKKVRDADVCA